MGIIVAKFRRKKDTYEVLEKLETEITSIEEFQKNTQQNKRNIVFKFILTAVITYCVLAFILYFYSSRFSNQKLALAIPLVGFPLVVLIIKYALTWYYGRKLKKNEIKLKSLKEEKRKILDNVMQTEVYNVAKKILEKFETKEVKTNIGKTPFVSKNLSAVNPSETELRQRLNAPQIIPRNRLSFGATPQTPLTGQRNLQPNPKVSPSGSPAIITAMRVQQRTPLPMPRGILARDRTVLDRMMDYLVGDGPSNRYALICKECCSHNGMALKEEFEYLSFRCCYCSAFNPARKKRPSAPKFELKEKASSPESNSDTETSDSEVQSKEGEEEKTVQPDSEKLSDIDKLSDLELKGSDNDNSPMDVDLETSNTTPVTNTSTTDKTEEINPTSELK